MRQRTAISTALLVLLVGGAVAFLFRKEDSARSPSRPAEEQLVRRHASMASEKLPPADVAVPYRQPVDLAGEDTPTKPPVASLSQFDRPDPSPPAISAVYPDFVNTEPDWQPEQAFPRSDTRSEAAIMPPARSGVIVHHIVDGDTLPALAAKYLGDASRSQEIFAANRDLLKHPDLLPIGAALRIIRSAD